MAHSIIEMSSLMDPPRLSTPHERCQQKLADLSRIAREQLKECNETAQNEKNELDYIIRWLENENTRLSEQVRKLEMENSRLRKSLGHAVDSSSGEVLEF